jgi:hypothetical protein
MGRDLKPPGTVDPARSALTVLLHIVVSIGYTMIIGLMVTRLRGLWAVGTGMLLGLGLYALNFVLFNYMLPVEWTGAELSVLVTHVVFGAIAAGAYKGLASRQETREIQA